MGKSVAMAELARRGSRALAGEMEGRVLPDAVPVVAMHFFRFNTPSAAVIPALFSLSAQLCGAVPGFRDAVPSEEEVRLAGADVSKLLS